MKRSNNMLQKKLKSKFSNMQKYILGVLISFMIPGTIFGFDFQEVRQSLKSDIMASNSNILKTTIAIVYNKEHREKVKKQINLVKFKKELSAELVRSFNVVDPMLVAKVLKINRLTYQSLSKSSDYLKGFSSRSESTHILFIDMQPEPRKLMVNLELLTPQGQKISKVHIEIPVDQVALSPTVQPEEPVSQSEPDNGDSFLDKLRDKFTPSAFIDDHNESFIYFTPTAYIQPETHAVDVLAWVEDIEDVVFTWMRVKYDVKFADRFQIGIQSNGISEKRGTDDEPNDDKKMGHHSTYGSLKYLIGDDNQLPVAIAMGVKGRLLWDKGNTDFETGDRDLDDKNKKRNNLTLFAAVTGKLDELGLLINFYLDNQEFGTGAKFLLTPDIKLFLDNVLYHYDGAKIDDDQAAGIQFYNSVGTTFTLSHQYETKQTQVAIGVNW